MITIYHNNHCSKSRQGLQLLEDSGKDISVVKYLDNPPTANELKDIITLLGIAPIDLVRKNEAIWKSDYKGKTMDDTAIIDAMTAHPKLIERPIVIHGKKAVIGRPPERILDIL